MNPVQDQVMQALVYPAIQMFVSFLPWLFGLGLLAWLGGTVISWIERMIVDLVRDVVFGITGMFGTHGVSREAIRRAKGSSRRGS